MPPLNTFQSRFLNALLILTLLVAGTLAVVLSAPFSHKGLAAPAALPGYAHSGIEVRNNDASALPAGYTVSFSLDTAALIARGELQADCDDLRISFADGSEVEIDRLVTGCNTANTVVQFRTQSAIDPGATDARYTMNYNNSGASNPPADPKAVFAFYDDFQDGNAAGWTVSKGNWGVILDGSNYVYRYTGGGANWPLAYVSVPFSDLDYLVKIRASDSPMTDFIGVAFRISNSTSFLTFYQSRDIDQFKYARIINDNHTIVQSPGFAMTGNTWYWLRLQAVGSALRARIWQDGTSEPGAWNIIASDTTYQSSSNIGLTLYNHTTNADWDDIQVRRLNAVEPTVSLVAPWWEIAWDFRQPVTITNTSTSTSIPVDFTASITLDTAALVGSGQMLATCDDLRVVYDPGLAATEIDRVVENCNTSETKIWFALQRPIAPNHQDNAYYLYYGNAAASSPPADGMKVFLYFEDWEQGASHWINAGGLDTGNSGAGTGTMGTTTVSNQAAFSSAHSQRLTVRASGGDAFSGFIPVSPSTAYTFRVWGSSESTTTCTPIGIDPYTNAYVQGTETWFWLDAWPASTTWAPRNYAFVTGADAAYIKIKSELWNTPGCPGSGPVYLDNLALHYSAASDPTLVLGEEEARAPVIMISNIVEDSDPVTLPNPIQISANITAAEGMVTSVTLRILSPQAVDVPMALVGGDNTNGSWQAAFTPSQGAEHTYRIYAVGSLGRNRLSEQNTFTAIDDLPPQITLVSVVDPILVRNTQTLVVQVTDNGVLGSVSLTTGGATHTMSVGVDDEYSYSWQVNTAGTVTYTVTASDTSGTTATLNGSFLVQPREADVCTWMGCRPAAASWSLDDGNSACRTDLESAGIRGTFFYNGNTTQSWFSDYSAAGHEIASHTVGHPCDPPACFPNCTLDTLMALPVNQAVADLYRTTQIEPNLQAIQAGTGKPVLSLAWPCGCTDPSRMQAAASSVLGSRGYYDYVAQLAWVEDINNPTPEHFQLLKTAASYRQDFVDRAIAEGKWSITTSHGSCDGISYLGEQSANGSLWAAPVGEVLKYIKVRDASQINNYTRSDQTISFDAVHTLSDFQPLTTTLPSLLPVVFDNPVTLQAHILDDDEVSSVTLDGSPAPYSIQTINGMRYVTLDASLNTNRHVVITLAMPAPTISDVDGAPDPLELGHSIQFTANVVPASGTTLNSVTLRVLSPEAGDYVMNQVGLTDMYTVSLTPNQVGNYTYQIIAANSQDRSSQSAVKSFTVVDTTPPNYRSQSQTHDQISMGQANILSAEGQDLGGMVRAILSTNESGSWQDFDWPADNDWWDHNWAYRRPVTLSENAGLARTNEIVDIAVSSADFTGLTGCASQLRVADQDKNEIPSQVYDEQVNGNVTCRLLFQATLGANATKTYYIYYGNPAATPPAYATDLNVTGTGLRTIQNTYFDLDLDTSENAGVITRVRLLQGNNINLPLSTSANVYWGWHQVCSSMDGNITGKNSLCQGGGSPASGLAAADTISGPLLREITLTSVKPNGAYTIAYRFFANTPYYQYSLARSGSTAVMNNFWYLNGNFGRLGYGTGGTPLAYFNTYDFSNDHLRISSLADVDRGLIDGTDNDGAFLGGTDYFVPTATGLNLYVTTGAEQSAAQGVLERLTAPLNVTPGAIESAPPTQHGSPIELAPGTEWVTTSFTWQHASLNDQRVQWRIRFVDASGNIRETPSMFFDIGSPTAVTLASFSLSVDLNTAQLDWETASEMGLVGFNLYRSDTSDGTRQKLNPELIAARHPGQMLGASYKYVDEVEPGLRYYYWLELIMNVGNELYGPLELTVDHKLFLPLMFH